MSIQRSSYKVEVFVPLPPSRCNSSQLHVTVSFARGRGLPPQLTILDLSYTGLQIIECQIADLISEAVEIHFIIVTEDPKRQKVG